MCLFALQMMREQNFDGLYLGTSFRTTKGHGCVIENRAILDWIPDGLAILDNQNKIVKANQRLTKWFNENLVGLDFYDGIGQSGYRWHRIHSIGGGEVPKNTVGGDHIANRRSIFYPCPLFRCWIPKTNANNLLVTLGRCNSNCVFNRKSWRPFIRPELRLADLRPEEIYQMGVEERIELLKDNILHYTKDLLDFDVIEIRMVDRETGLLEPLLSVGIDSEIAREPLYAKSVGNGVTGFVVATGQSYLCEDTTNDPLYLDGLVGARSSLTVPLIYHDEVIGSFNVESPEVKAFDEDDLHFLECFARDIAVSLNTLELLNAQRTDAAMQSVLAIHEAVSAPIDEILSDAVHAIESYIGHDPDVTRRLRTILGHARQIKKAIQRVGQEMAPEDAVPSCVQSEIRPALRGKNILVIDADEQVRRSARQLLGRYGCDVETAHRGTEAIMMVRNCGFEEGYDAIIADIRLPDIGGYDLLMKLKELVAQPPLILMTGFGYDPGHSIVKARQAGLRKDAVLFKPFRIDQLIKVTESVVTTPVGS